MGGEGSGWRGGKGVSHLRLAFTVTHFLGVDELFPKFIFSIEQAPIHLDVPSEGVASADDGRYYPQEEQEEIHTRLCLQAMFRV